MKNGLGDDDDVSVITADDVQPYFQNEDYPELTKFEIELVSSHLKRTAGASIHHSQSLCNRAAVAA